MTTRAQLKQHAKSVLKPNYWKIVLVSLLLFVIGGGASGISTSARAATNMNFDSGVQNEAYSVEDFEEIFPGLDIEVDEEPVDEFYSGAPAVRWFERIFAGPLGLLVIIAGLFGSLFGLLSTIFLLNPLVVGCHRFFLVSQHFPAKLREVAYSFDTDYLNAVVTMLFRAIKIVLWSLLLVIPGIVKTYEYRMIPYLLAEHPDMPRKEIFAASRMLMSGNKWRAFVLDLSFILWELLSALTLGVVGILYVGPYRNLTNAAFYEAVCREKQG